MSSKTAWISDAPRINTATVFVVWLGFSLFLSVCFAIVFWVAKKPFSFSSLLLGNAICCLLWALFTPFILWLSRRVFIKKPNALLKLSFHLCASFLIGLMHLSSFTFVFSMIQKGAGRDTGAFSDKLIDLITFYLNTDLLYYWCVVLIFHGLTYLKRSRERELTAAQLQEQLARANLQALKMQFHPHFLFNTLNSAASLIRLDKTDAAIMTLSDLSDLLRQSMQYSGEQMTSIKEEFAFIKKYLAVERRRFPDRMKVNIEVASDCESAQIPAFLLQPLIENTIKHGVAKTTATISIQMNVRRRDSELHISIVDDGTGLGTAPVEKEGFGLSMTRSRLAQLFPDNHRFEIGNRKSRGVRVHISIPYRLEGCDAET